MKLVAIYLFKIILNIIYFFMKLIPRNNKKVVFISRQSNQLTLDFRLLKEKLLQEDSNIKITCICKRMNKSFLSGIGYFFTILRQMYAIATSKVVVIDSYCIPVSILRHKKNTFILQIWHSIGKIKKSGYQTLDTPSGRNSKIAKAMNMHKNYDAIIAGAPVFDKFYEEGFNVTNDKLLHYGLPRIDYLLAGQETVKNEIYQVYPEFNNKKIVLYVPTFRTYTVHGLDKLINNYNPSDFVLIVKSHPNQKLNSANIGIYECNEFTSTDLLMISDYVITDYSSIALEAAVLNKKVLFYVYDYDKYMSNNGLNIDFYKVLPSCSSKEANDLLQIIKTDKYDDKAYQKFRKKYLPDDLGNSTLKITKLIMENLSR